MRIMSQMSSIMGQMESEHPELFALEFGKIVESDFLVKFSQNVCDHKILDYGFNQTRPV